MTKITHISADEGKLELWHLKNSRCFGKIAIASSDPVEIARTLIKHGFENTFSKASSFDFGEESGFKTDDAPSLLLNKAFEIYYCLKLGLRWDKGE